MKKIILITIICFLIPCFGIAQEPDSISSIEGTLWSTGQIQAPGDWKGPMYFGFYDGDIYLSFYYGWYDLYYLPFTFKHSYGDLGTVSYFFMIGPPPVSSNPNDLMAIGGLMFPLGFGIISPGGILRKIEDNWDPSGWEGGY